MEGQQDIINAAYVNSAINTKVGFFLITKSYLKHLAG